MAVLLPPAALVLLALTADAAAAQDLAGGALEAMIGEMRRQLGLSGDRLGAIARSAMVALLAVDFTLRAGRAIIGNDGFEPLLQGFAFQIGFVACVWLLATIVPEFVDWLAGTAITIAGEAGAGETDVGGLVAAGISRSVSWLKQMRPLNPGTWFYALAAMVYLTVLAVTVAMLVVIWAELYLVGLAGVTALLFAGLTETRGIALRYVSALIGKGFKLLGLLVIVEASGEMTSALALRSGSGFENAMTMVLLQIVTAVLVLTLPGTLESLVGGIPSAAGERTGRVAGGVARGAVTVGSAAAAGAVLGAAGGAASAARAGTGATGVASATLGGLRDGAIDWGRMARNGDLGRHLGHRVAERIGYGGARTPGDGG